MNRCKRSGTYSPGTLIYVDSMGLNYKGYAIVLVPKGICWMCFMGKGIHNLFAREMWIP